MDNNLLFLDNASTTKPLKSVVDCFLKVQEIEFFNPSSLSGFSFSVSKKIEQARKNILNCLNASNSDLLFCSGATECNNLAFSLFKRGIAITSMGEHPSIFAVAEKHKGLGKNVLFVNLQANGSVDIEDFKSKMSPDVSFVSVMFVSNETGAINDIKQLVFIAKSVNPKVIFHCDCVQALGKIKVDFDYLGVDCISISAHKIHGLKGIAALVFKKNINICPMIVGGHQENGRRAGTENVGAILSFDIAVSNAVNNQKHAFENAFWMKNALVNELNNMLIPFVLHSSNDCSPFILSISFAGVRGETLMHALEEDGIVIGTGSACSSKTAGNRILQSMNIPQNEILQNVRISFGNEKLSEDSLKFIAKAIAEKINKLKVK